MTVVRLAFIPVPRHWDPEILIVSKHTGLISIKVARK
ncbi:WPE palindromic element domain-containing protein [Wolbachia endosymbiont (group A) of Cydia strobilella]